MTAGWVTAHWLERDPSWVVVTTPDGWPVDPCRVPLLGHEIGKPPAALLASTPWCGYPGGMGWQQDDAGTWSRPVFPVSPALAPDAPQD